MPASWSWHAERLGLRLGFRSHRLLRSRCSAELAGQRSVPEGRCMSGFVAAAAALHLLPASMGTAVPPQTGLVPGSFGITPEDLKLLADSDSDVEEEGQALVGAAAAVPADAPGAASAAQGAAGPRSGAQVQVGGSAETGRADPREGGLGIGPARRLLPELPTAEEEDHRAAEAPQR